MEYLTNNTKQEFISLLEDSNNATSFKHFKGNIYKIVTIAKDADTLEDVVIYQGCYGDKPVWSRKVEEFFSLVDKEKYPEVKQKYRFEKVE